MIQHKKHYLPLILITLGALIILAILARMFLLPLIEKWGLTKYLETPTNLTIYEQNNHPEYPKTKISIPEHSGYLINIHKDEHKLYLYRDNEIIREYDVNIRRDEPDRQMWEDDQTPEGIFHIETMDPVSDPPWERWMRLDTTDHARNLYVTHHDDGQRRIDAFESQYGPIAGDREIRQFNQINADQKMLRGVGIHGGGFSLYHEWTVGCPAMADEDVIELFDLLKSGVNRGIGTPVVIQD